MQYWLNILNTLILAELGSMAGDREQLPYKVRELLPVSSKEEVETAKIHYRSKVNQARKQGITVPFERLCEICEYDSTAQRLLELSLAVYTYPVLKEFFRWLGMKEDITLQLVTELFFGNEEIPPTYSQLKKSYGLLERIFIPSITGESFLNHPFVMDDRLYGYLLGQQQPEEEISFFLNPKPDTDKPYLWIHQEQAKELEEYLRSGITFLQVRGEPGAGKRHLVHYVCDRYGFPLMEVNGKKLGYLELGKLKAVIRKLKREILFQESALCIYGIEQESKNTKGWEIPYFLEEVMYPLLETDYPIFVCSNGETNLIGETETFVGQIPLESLNRTERYALWKGFSDLWGLRDLQEEILSSKFRLNAKEIKKVASILPSDRREKNSPRKSSIRNVCF